MSNTKTLLQTFCKYVYYAGAGNFWYENIYRESIGYKIYHVVSFFIYFTMILLENMATLFGEFPDVEKQSALMFAAIHDIILAKMLLVLFYKNSIRKLNNEMATLMGDIEEETIMKEQYKKVKWGIILYVITVYLSLIAFGIESLRKVIVEGAPFYTVVTYFPHYADGSTLADTLRVFFYMTWLYMMLPMISADCMPIIHLITMAYKFVTLCRHFEKIRRDFDGNIMFMKNGDAHKILKYGCLQGIKMHQKLIFQESGSTDAIYLYIAMTAPFNSQITDDVTMKGTRAHSATPTASILLISFVDIAQHSLAEEIHRVFGIIMSLQVCESSAVAVLLLLRLALAPHMNLTNAFMTYTFVGSLFVLLALNLWNAGEITYQEPAKIIDYQQLRTHTLSGCHTTADSLSLYIRR